MINPFPRNALAACAVISSMVTSAQAVPQAAANKTVIVAYTGEQPGYGDKGSKTVPLHVSFQIYISSQGRLFVKNEARTAQRAKEKELDPSSSNFRFAGNTIVGTRSGASTNGATRITITFDASYQSCNASVIVGTPNGAAHTWISLSGERMTATGPITISGITCSVSQGNAFAN